MMRGTEIEMFVALLAAVAMLMVVALIPSVAPRPKWKPDPPPITFVERWNYRIGI